MNRQIPHIPQTVSASQFGSGFESYGDCRGFNRSLLADEAAKRIPILNPNHQFSPEHYRNLALWWRLGKAEPLYISGPSGSGKTSTAMQFCARLGVPVVSVTARARMDRRELIGHYVVRDHATVWQDGPATMAWRYGWTLIINEFSTAPADMWVSCNDILEGLPLDNDATGEVILRHPDTRVIVTDNTRGHTVEIEEGFYGRQVQDRSVIDRFWHLRMESHTEEMAARLLMAGIDESVRQTFDERSLERLCTMLARAGRDSLSAARTQTIGFQSCAVPISLRALMRLRDMVLAAASENWGNDDSGLLLRELIRMSFTEALDETARETAEGLLMTALGNIVGLLRQAQRRSSCNR